MKNPRIILLIFAPLLLAGASQAQYDGFAACSTSDSGSRFWYEYPADVYVVGPDVSLLPEGDYPYDAVMRPGYPSEVWIPGAVGDGVVVIGEDGTVARTIPVGEYPVSVAFNPREDIALVSCRDSDRLDIVDVNTYQVIDSLPIPGTFLGPGNLIFDPQGDRFFLVAWYDDILFEIAADGSAIVDQANLGSSLWQLVIDPNFGGNLFVTDRGSDTLWVVDPETLLAVDSYTVGDDPWGVDVDYDIVVVVCEDSGEVDVIDVFTGTTTVVPLPAGADPRDVNITTGFVTVGGAKNLLGGVAYVAGGTVDGTSPVYAIDIFTAAVVDTIVLPGTNANVVAVEPQWPIPTGVDDTPARPALTLQAAPNPFNPATVIAFELSRSGTGWVRVYDPAGRPVRELFTGAREAGPHTCLWDGTDAQGAPVASGVYLVHARFGAAAATTKVVLVE